jgi:hypothetical protein
VSNAVLRFAKLTAMNPEEEIKSTCQNPCEFQMFEAFIPTQRMFVTHGKLNPKDFVVNSNTHTFDYFGT